MFGYLKFCAKINEIQRIVGSDINRTIGAFVIIKSVISQKKIQKLGLITKLQFNNPSRLD